MPSNKGGGGGNQTGHNKKDFPPPAVNRKQRLQLRQCGVAVRVPGGGHEDLNSIQLLIHETCNSSLAGTGAFVLPFPAPSRDIRFPPLLALSQPLCPPPPRCSSRRHFPSAEPPSSPLAPRARSMTQRWDSLLRPRLTHARGERLIKRFHPTA